MMKRHYIIAISILGLLLPGCSAFEYLDGSSQRQVGEFNANKEVMLQEIDRLQQENRELEEQNEYLQKKYGYQTNLNSPAKTSEPVTHMDDQIFDLEVEDNEPEIEIQQQPDTQADYQLTEKELDNAVNKEFDIINQNASAVSAPDIYNKDISSLKIKVLTGNGNIHSAQLMKKKLVGMGYPVSKIGSAPRSNFKQNTIYFSQSCKDDAVRLVSDYGGDIVVKPLTWHSVFDLIVVAAR